MKNLVKAIGVLFLTSFLLTGCNESETENNTKVVSTAVTDNKANVDKETNKLNLSATDSKVIPAEPTKDVKTYKVGDTFKLGSMSYKVNSTKISMGDDSTSMMNNPMRGNKFLYVNLTLHNGGKEPFKISPVGQFSIRDSNDKTCMQAMLAVGKKAMFGVAFELAPNEEFTGDIVVEAPKDETDYTLHLVTFT